MIRQFLISIDIPKWARWYAMNSSGYVWIYRSKPLLCEFYWKSSGRKMFVMEVNLHFMPGIDWTQTLHEIERVG